MKVRICREAERNGFTIHEQVSTCLHAALTFIKENGFKKRDFFVAEGSENLDNSNKDLIPQNLHNSTK